MAMSGLYVMIIAIQPMWAIEEYAMIFRSWVWFSPPQPPMRIESAAMVVSIFVLIVGIIWYRIDIGATFCQVRSSMPDDSGLPCVTSGTQKWNGAIPSFMAIDTVMMADGRVLCVFVMVHCPEDIRSRVMASISSMDAVAWIRKYFVAASMARGLKFFIRIGTIASMFISNPIQIISQ